MIKSSIEKISYSIGYDIGHSDDQVQSDLINGFADAINNSMQPRDMETQLCYIVDKLNANSTKMLKSMLGFVELKEV